MAGLRSEEPWAWRSCKTAAVFLALALACGKQTSRKTIVDGAEHTTGGTSYLADGTPWSVALAARSRCAAARERAMAGKKTGMMNREMMSMYSPFRTSQPRKTVVPVPILSE